MRVFISVFCAVVGLAPAALAQPVDHQQIDHAATIGAASPQEAGDAAFAAIQEIVEMLEADPSTDWSKVNIEALRQHLIDMNGVTLRASVETTITGNQVTFDVSGEGLLRDSIRRMVTAHAAAMQGQRGWRYASEISDTGARLYITTPDATSLAKVRALGLVGVMTLGMHHSRHHMIIARGMSPHG